MGYFAGLDVSLEETAICIVDAAGRIVREARAASEPEALVAFFASMKVKQAMRASACEANRRRSSSSHSSVAKKLSHMALS